MPDEKYGGGALKLLNVNFFLLIMAMSCIASASWWKAIPENNAGVESFKEELEHQAHEKFISALAEDPDSAIIHLNLGVTFEKNKEFKKALSEYRQAIDKASDSESRFLALFNAARMEGQLKKIGSALVLYQTALEIVPTSKEVKTNIELLLQQQSQQQKGGGGKNNDKKNKDKNQEGDRDDPNRKMVNRRKQEPKPFKSKHLSKKDVDKILDELKRQEKKVRKEQSKKAPKENPREKDW